MSSTDKQVIGKIGEDAAAAFLEKNGFTVIERNLRIFHKEIDLIAESQTDLIFVEVKARRQDPNARAPFGRPSDAVDYRKRKNVADGAQLYLYQNPTAKMPRLDVIEVFISPQDPPSVQHINWFKDAFDANGRL